MDNFVKLVNRITDYTGITAAYLLIPVILTIVYSVILRYCFHDVVHWAFEVSLFLYGIFYMVGGAYALKEQSHVRVDILPGRLSHRWNCLIDLFSYLIIIFICAVFIYIGTRFAWVSTLELERSIRQTPFDPPIWWYKWFIPFSAAILGLQALVEAIKTFQSLNSK